MRGNRRFHPDQFAGVQPARRVESTAAPGHQAQRRRALEVVGLFVDEHHLRQHDADRTFDRTIAHDPVLVIELARRPDVRQLEMQLVEHQFEAEANAGILRRCGRRLIFRQEAIEQAGQRGEQTRERA